MPHSIFGGDELSPGLYGDHEILTFMAQEASKGPPKEVFWRMQEENEPFYHAMSEYAGTAIGDDPLARYEDEDEQDSGEDEADIYDYESFFIPEEGAALEKSFDAMEDGDVKQGLSDIGDIVSSAWDWASNLGSSLLGLGGDIFEDLSVPPIPMSAEAAGPIPDWAGMGLEEDIFRDIGPFTPTDPVARPMPVGNGPSFDDIRRDILIDKLLSESMDSIVPEMLDDYAVGAQEIGSNIPFLSVGGGGGIQGQIEAQKKIDEGQQEIFNELNEAVVSSDPMGMIRDLINAGVLMSDLQAWMDAYDWAGNTDLLGTLEREFGIQRTGGVPPPPPAPTTAPTTGKGGVIGKGDIPTDTGEPMSVYSSARANLRVPFYTTIYRQEDAEQASESELTNLLNQTRILFFLEQGETAWEDLKDYASQRTAYEEIIEPFADEPRYRSTYEQTRSEDRPTLEKNYEEWLGGYLKRPFAQRLNPTEGKDFYTLVRDVSDMLGQDTGERSVWVEGLFGGEELGQKNIRDELVKMSLTRGGTGYYAQRIHNAAQKQMDYYRNIGWTEARIFDHMTKGMKKSQAADEPLPDLES